MESVKTRTPDKTTMMAFLGVVLIGGFNFVAVRFSNEGFDPFFGAGMRFLVASLLLFGAVIARRIPWPTRTQLKGTLLYGVFGFGIAYALAYLALVRLPSAVAAVLMGAVPLITLFLAVGHRVERFSWRGVAGGVVAIAGIVVMVGTPSDEPIAIGALIAMLGAAVGAAESGVIVKRFPIGHPMATNAVAMFSGSLLLLVLSRASGEEWSLSVGGATWAALAYLIVMGSIALFGLYLFTLKRWSASGVSYMFVLTPIVAAISGSVLAEENLAPSIIAGGVIVLAGVYLGALSPAKPRALEGAADAKDSAAA